MGVKYVIDNTTMTQIADPLRSLAGRSDELTPAEMAAAGNAATEAVSDQTDLIAQIQSALVGKTGSSSGGGITPIGTKQITVNGTYDVTAYASANVNVPSKEPVTEELIVSANGTYTPGSGVDGFHKVVVEVSEGTDGTAGTLVLTMEDGSVVDLSEVEEISITPGGSVAKIASNTGEVLWEKPSGGLPSGWILANYVQFTGAQTVDTGIVPTQDTRIEATFTKEGTTAMYLYGVRNSANTASLTAYLNTNGAWRFGNVYKNLTLTANKEYSIVQDKNGVVLNGTNNAYGTVSNFTANGTLTIGSSRGTDGSLGTSQFVGPVKEFRMYSGDTLVLELLPVYNATEGIYAFYDTVSGAIMKSITDDALQGGR